MVVGVVEGTLHWNTPGTLDTVALVVVVEEGILDIPVVEGTLVVAAAVLRGILMAEDKGLSTLSDSNSAHTDLN